MTRLRHVSVWLLLVSLLAGGVVAPVAHWVQHGFEHAAAAEEACHSTAVHNSAVALWTEEDSDLDLLDCDLCATRLMVVSQSPGPDLLPDVTETTQVEMPSYVVVGQTVVDRFIRGPPSVLGARSA